MRDFVIDNILIQSRPTLKELGVYRLVSTQWRQRVDAVVYRIFNQLYGIPGMLSFRVGREIIEAFFRTTPALIVLNRWDEVADIPMTRRFLKGQMDELRASNTLWYLYRINHNITRNYKKNGPIIRRINRS